LLTVDNEEQALDRAGLTDSSEDKGTEAAEAGLAMALLAQGTFGLAGRGIPTGFR
jgi:6,7-dimethyl-8-ribityllumazine synthase